MQLIGLGAMSDRAEGETFRLAAGSSTQVLVSQASTGSREATLRLTNANPFAVAVDVPIGSAGQAIHAQGGDLPLVDGIPTWSRTLAPGEDAELRYGF
jgi:hypothetical protein